jgi:hypothetical protein
MALSYNKSFVAEPLQLLSDAVGLYERHGNGIWNQKRNTILMTATWNVRSMFQPGKMVEIADEARKFKTNT